MASIRVLVVDDHALFRRGIAAVLANQENLEVVGEASDGLEAIQKAKEIAPDVILMDLNMPQCSGLRATQVLQAEMPEINILVLTCFRQRSRPLRRHKIWRQGFHPQEYRAGRADSRCL